MNLQRAANDAASSVHQAEVEGFTIRYEVDVIERCVTPIALGPRPGAR